MRRRRSLVGTMATTAVVVGTAKAVGGAMDGAADQKAAAQQQAADRPSARQPFYHPHPRRG